MVPFSGPPPRRKRTARRRVFGPVGTPTAGSALGAPPRRAAGVFGPVGTPTAGSALGAPPRVDSRPTRKGGAAVDGSKRRLQAGRAPAEHTDHGGARTESHANRYAQTHACQCPQPMPPTKTMPASTLAKTSVCRHGNLCVPGRNPMFASACSPCLPGGKAMPACARHPCLSVHCRQSKAS